MEKKANEEATQREATSLIDIFSSAYSIDRPLTVYYSWVSI